MPKIRIYTKSGHQVELDVRDFTVYPDKDGGYYKWEATWRMR